MKQKLFICLLFFITILPVNSQVIQQTSTNNSIQPGKTYAVIVGISKYENVLTQLEYADRDAKVFADYLESKAGGSVPEENIRLLTNDNATFTAIYNALDWLLEVCKKDDLVYFYFSGHGDVENSTIYKLGFLLSYNTPRTNYINNAVRLEDLNNIANTLSVERKAKVILITDACHSGNLAGKDFRGNFLVGEQLRSVKGNETRITSCGPDQLSNEDEGWGGGRGVFSYYLINGLTGLADKTPDGIITVDEIKDYLNSSLASDILLAQKKDKQDPVVNGRGDFKLASVDDASLNSLKQRLSGNASQTTRPLVTTFLKPLAIQPQGYLFNLIGENNIEELVDFNKLNKLSKEEIPFAFIKMLVDTLQKTSAIVIDSEKISQLERSLKENNDALNRFNAKLVETLSDRGQEVINLYLSGNAAELERRRYYNAYSNSYDVYPKMFSIALKLVSPEHKLYKILQVKLYYFSGVAARLKIPTVEDMKPLLDLAMAEQMKAFALEENAAYIEMELGTLYDYKEDYVTAEKHYLRATQIAPEWAIPWTNLIGVYVNTKRYDKALKASKTAIALQPDYQGIYVNSGLFYQKTGNLLLAEELYRKSIKMNSRHFAPFEGLGYLYMNTTQYVQADSFFYEADLRKQGFYNPKLIRLPKPVLPDFEDLSLHLCLFDSIDVGKNDVMGHFAWGMNAFNNKDFAGAEREFKKVIALDKTNPLAFHYLGKIPYMQKRWEEADIIFNYAVDYYLDDSAFAQYYDSLANLLPNTNSKECILEEFKTDYYSRAEDHYFLSTLYEAWNHFSEAEEHYRKIISLDPSFVGGYYRLWMMLENIGRFKDAEDVIHSYAFYDNEIADRELNSFYKRMIKRFPDVADWYYKAGLFLYHFAGKTPYGFREDRKKIAPDSEDDTYVLPPTPNFTLQMSANVYKRFILPGITDTIVIADKIFHPFTEGINYLKKADSLIQQDEDALAGISYKIGDLYAWQGLPERAAPYYKRSVDLKPDDANTRIKLIEIYSMLYQLTDALAQLDSLYERKEINFSKQLLMAKYCIQAGRYADAEKLLKEAEQIHLFKIPEITNLNGRMQLLSNKPKLALPFYQEYLKLNPDDPLVIYTIARLYAQMKNTNEAWKWLRLSIEKGFNYYWVLKFDASWNNFRSQGKWKDLNANISVTEYPSSSR